MHFGLKGLNTALREPQTPLTCLERHSALSRNRPQEALNNASSLTPEILVVPLKGGFHGVGRFSRLRAVRPLITLIPLRMQLKPAFRELLLKCIAQPGQLPTG